MDSLPQTTLETILTTKTTCLSRMTMPSKIKTSLKTQGPKKLRKKILACLKQIPNLLPKLIPRLRQQERVSKSRKFKTSLLRWGKTSKKKRYK